MEIPTNLELGYNKFEEQYMGVSKNRGTPKSFLLIGFSMRNHPFWGTVPLFLVQHPYEPQEFHSAGQNTDSLKAGVEDVIIKLPIVKVAVER